VIDRDWATIGSTNLDNFSFSFNNELNLIVYDRTVARYLTQVFEADVSVSRRLTYEGWKRRGLGARLLELLALPIRDIL
jgi:cardiolipin synthase